MATTKVAKEESLVHKKGEEITPEKESEEKNNEDEKNNLENEDSKLENEEAEECTILNLMTPSFFAKSVLDLKESFLVKNVIKDYEGQMLNELFHGEGRADIVGGHCYTGQFQVGFMHGIGTYHWSDGLIYQGDFVRNQMTGIGTFTWPDGSYYSGDVRNSIRHGRGIFYHAPRKIKYDGQWCMGVQQGKGVMTFDEDGESYYNGDWVNDKKQGIGTRKYISGNIYDGEWLNNLRHGHGTMQWLKDRQTYVGQWCFGVQEGEGEHTWYHKRSPTTQYYLRNSYRGSFKNGLREGRGCFLYATGAYYDGEWKANRKNGKGKLVFKNGRVYEGEFLDDQIVEYPDVDINDLQSDEGVKVIRTRTPLPSESRECNDIITVKESMLGFRLNISQILADFRDDKERCNEHLQVLNAVLRYNTYTKRIYSFYSRLGYAEHETIDNVYSLSQMQMWRFMKDCKFQEIQRLELPDYDGFLSPDRNPFDPMREIYYEEFLSDIVIIAYTLFRLQTKCGPYISSCYVKLLREYVLKNACQVNGYFFHTVEKAHEVMQQCRVQWNYYQDMCFMLNANNLERRCLKTITMRQFLWLLHDLNLIDVTLKAADVIDVLASDDRKVRYHVTCICMEFELGFYDYVEALVGCSQVKRHPICYCCFDARTFMFQNEEKADNGEVKTEAADEEEDNDDGEGGDDDDGSKGNKKDLKKLETDIRMTTGTDNVKMKKSETLVEESPHQREGGEEGANDIGVDKKCSESQEENKEQSIGIVKGNTTNIAHIGNFEATFSNKFQKFVVHDYIAALDSFLKEKMSKRSEYCERGGSDVDQGCDCNLITFCEIDIA